MLVLLAVGVGGACDAPPEAVVAATQVSPATPRTLFWHDLGDWSGRGSRQTESFDVTTGSLRFSWETAEASGTPEDGSGHLRVSLHSAISGRPLQTLVDARGAARGDVRFATEPRVAYLLVESTGITWSVRLEEGVPAEAD